MSAWKATHQCNSFHQSPKQSHYHSGSGSCQWCFYTFHWSTDCLSFCIRWCLIKQIGVMKMRPEINDGTTQAVCCVYVRIRTFEKGSAVDEVPSMREALATRAQLGILWAALFRTLVTLRAPGYTHWAAASIHAVPAIDGCPAALILMGQVALFSTQV